MFNFGEKVGKVALSASVALLIPVAALADWAGPYGGVALGYGSGKSQDVSFGPGSFNVNGTQVSLFGGYNWQSGNYVYGGELSFGFGDIDGNDGAFMRPLKISNTAMLKARFGYDSGAFMPYGFIGAASSKFKADHNGLGTTLASDRFSGFAYGVGLDYKIGGSSFVRAELSRVNYRAGGLDFGGDRHGIGASGVTSFTIGVGMSF